VQIIVLDLRTRRSPLRSGAKIYDNMGSYEAHGESDDQVMLGDVQWKWLETELRRPADLRFIGLSTQLGVGFNGYEAWANFPREKERFFALLRKTGAEGVVLLSGDTHWGEINVRDDPDFYPVFDVTSSGVNQNWSAPGASDCRIGPPLNEPNVGFVEIDWSRPDPRVDVRLIDQTGAVRRALTMQRSELSIGAPSIDRASLLAKAMEGSWESAFGAIEFRRDGERVVAQYPGGSCDLRIEGGRLVGAWREGERTGLCSFTPVRCGRFLLGAYGRGEGPVLLAWPCWRAGAIETHDPPTRHSP